MLLPLQRAAGNAATAELIRREPSAVRNLANHSSPVLGVAALIQRDVTGQGQGANVVKDMDSRLKDWRTNANAGVGEAVHGTLEQRIKDVTAFNSDALVGAVLGNVIWALASFATGGVAFAISIAGIAVGAAYQIPKESPSKTPIADIEEAMYQQLDVVQQNAKDGAQQLSDMAAANGRPLTLSEAMRQIFAPDQLTASAMPDIEPAKVRAAYRNSAEALFAKFDSEVDPIGGEIDVTEPDRFVKDTTKARLIYIRNLGYVVAYRPHRREGDPTWRFLNFVSPEMVRAAKAKAVSSGEGPPIPSVAASDVGYYPPFTVVPLPVPAPPEGPRQIHIGESSGPPTRTR